MQTNATLDKKARHFWGDWYMHTSPRTSCGILGLFYCCEKFGHKLNTGTVDGKLKQKAHANAFIELSGEFMEASLLAVTTSTRFERTLTSFLTVCFIDFDYVGSL